MNIESVDEEGVREYWVCGFWFRSDAYYWKGDSSINLRP